MEPVQNDLGPVPPIRVPDQLRRPHAAVEAARALAAARGRDFQDTSRLRRQAVSLHVTKAALSRALRLADALVKAAEARGHSIRPSTDDQHGAAIVVRGEPVDLSIREPSKRTRHIATPEELARAKKSPVFGSVPSYDYEASGLLVFRIENAYGHRTEWKESKRWRADESLVDVLAGIESSALKMIEIRLENARREREAWEREKRALEEAERVKRLDVQVNNWRRAREIRSFVTAMQDAAAEDGCQIDPASELGQWLAWALRYADRIDPVRPSHRDES
jgi:hypothetical protein